MADPTVGQVLLRELFTAVKAACRPAQGDSHPMSRGIDAVGRKVAATLNLASRADISAQRATLEKTAQAVSDLESRVRAPSADKKLNVTE